MRVDVLLLGGGAAFFGIAALLRFVPRLATDPPPWVVPAVVAASAIGAALASGAPTGVAGVDALLRAGLGAAAVASGALAPLGAAWAAVAAVAALAAVSSPADGAAGAALGAVAADRLTGSPTQVVGALAAGAATQAALRFEDADVTGTPSLLALAVLAPLLAGGWRYAPRRFRRRALWVAAGVTVFCLAAGGMAAYAAGRSIDDVSDATAAAQRGIDLLGGDDDAAAEAALAEAAAAFEEVRDRFDAWWARPARLVPFVAQQTRAVRTMAAVGADLSTAAESAAGVDFDRVRPQDGVVDLAALDEALGPVEEADRVLRSAVEQLDDIDSPWLLAPVDDRWQSLDEKVTDAAATADLAATIGGVLPELLGGDDSRRYLLLVQQPAEARGAGGLPGNYGEITAEGGRLDLVDFGRIADLDARMPPFGERTVEVGDGHRTIYGYGFHDLLWQNTTLDPDFEVAADVASQLWDMTGAEPVDGVLSIDPFAVRALLEVVGPLTLEDGTILGPDNALPYLLNEQYAAVADDAARVDLLGEAAERGWDALTTGALPGPRALADAFGPAVEGRHLLFTSFDGDERAALDEVGIAGGLDPPRGDGVGVVTVNLGQNKIDYFLERTSAYRARWDPDSGLVDGTYTVTLSNSAPATGQPPAVIAYGGPVSTDPQLAPAENFLQAYLYTAMVPAALRIDGADTPLATVEGDDGWFVNLVAVRVPPGGAVTLEVDVTGEIAGDAWNLDVVRQPPINADRLVVDLDVTGEQVVADGLAAGADDLLHGEFPLAEPVRAGVRPR